MERITPDVRYPSPDQRDYLSTDRKNLTIDELRKICRSLKTENDILRTKYKTEIENKMLLEKSVSAIQLRLAQKDLILIKTLKREENLLNKLREYVQRLRDTSEQKDISLETLFVLAETQEMDIKTLHQRYRVMKREYNEFSRPVEFTQSKFKTLKQLHKDITVKNIAILDKINKSQASTLKDRFADSPVINPKTGKLLVPAQTQTDLPANDKKTQTTDFETDFDLHFVRTKFTGRVRLHRKFTDIQFMLHNAKIEDMVNQSIDIILHPVDERRCSDAMKTLEGLYRTIARILHFVIPKYARRKDLLRNLRNDIRSERTHVVNLKEAVRGFVAESKVAIDDFCQHFATKTKIIIEKQNNEILNREEHMAAIYAEKDKIAKRHEKQLHTFWRHKEDNLKQRELYLEDEKGEISLKEIKWEDRVQEAERAVFLREMDQHTSYKKVKELMISYTKQTERLCSIRQDITKTEFMDSQRMGRHMKFLKNREVDLYERIIEVRDNLFRVLEVKDPIKEEKHAEKVIPHLLSIAFAANKENIITKRDFNMTTKILSARNKSSAARDLLDKVENVCMDLHPYYGHCVLRKDEIPKNELIRITQKFQQIRTNYKKLKSRMAQARKFGGLRSGYILDCGEDDDDNVYDHNNNNRVGVYRLVNGSRTLASRKEVKLFSYDRKKVSGSNNNNKDKRDNRISSSNSIRNTRSAVGSVSHHKKSRHNNGKVHIRSKRTQYVLMQQRKKLPLIYV